MKKRIALTGLLTVMLAVLIAGISLFFTGCSTEKYAENLMLHITFDEGEGNQVADASGNLGDATIQYVYTNAAYKSSEDPQWRSTGVVDGSILFDGYSNYISYSWSDIQLTGSSLTVAAYVAPRVFEWDDPNAKENGTDHLTAIVSQCYPKDYAGFILGYWRYGELSFQVGIGDRWLTVWSEDARLSKYEWNYVVAQFDGEAGEMRLYLNGELVASETFFEGATIAKAYDEPLYIGRNSYPSSNTTATENMVSGMLDDIRIYNTVVDEEFIRTTYETNGLPSIEYEDISLQNILTDDIYKTQYHGGPYQMWMNEPHAPIYYKGTYHLFFQLNLTGPYWKQICWGHLVSDDMVNWTPMPEVITPTDGSVCPDGVWSGGATYDSNGIPVLFFTAGNDSYASDGLISNQNIGVAYPADPDDPLLTEWIVADELAIEQKSGQGRTGEFRDAHLWQEDGTWFMLVGSGSASSSGGTALLYRTDTLTVDYAAGEVIMDWEYSGPIYTISNQASYLGTSWELPVLLPISNEEGTVTKYVFMISPAPASSADNKIYYFVGTFNSFTGKFTPDEEFADGPHMLDYGANVFTGPSAFIDPVSGNVYMFSVMQDYRSSGEVYAAGWANCVGLARRVWLNDEGTDVQIAPVSALDKYSSEIAEGTDLTLSEANALLAKANADLVCVKLTIRNVSASSFGIRVKCNDDFTDMTTFTYSVPSSTITGATLNPATNVSASSTSGSLALQDDCLTIVIYIDRSLVEAFFNDAKALSIRSYAAFDSTAMLLFADGDVQIESLYVGAMRSIY